jgi:predicted aspartyl protease
MRWRPLAALVGIALLASGARAEVPLRWDSSGHVVVPAVVNGKGPFDFILDTGADESAVYAWFAKLLDLPKGRSGMLSGATGTQPMVSTRVSSLALDGHAIRNVDADTVPDRVDGIKLAGVAGVDLMQGQLVVIDFGCNTVAVLPIRGAPTDIAGAGATLIRAGSIRDGKQLTLPVTVNGAPGTAVLDTGARATAINLKFALAAGADPLSSTFRDGEPTRGATMTPVDSRIGTIGTVRFAGITRTDAVARVVDLPYLDGAGLAKLPAMNLGLDLLRGTRLSIDYASRRLWLAPSRCGAPSAKPAS